MKKTHASAAGEKTRDQWTPARGTRSDPSPAGSASHAALNTSRSPGAATDRLSWVNSGLMLAACGSAYLAPFHLFLFSYAVLGPLHYFTEISWLHDREYFAGRAPARRWWLALVAVAMATLMYGYVSNDLLQRPVSPKYEIAMVYLVFATAAMLLYVRRAVSAVVLAGASLAALALFSTAQAYFILAYLLVTIV